MIASNVLVLYFFSFQPPDYPEITIQSETESRAAAHCESAQMAFLSHECGPWKQALNTWWDFKALLLIMDQSEKKKVLKATLEIFVQDKSIYTILLV